MGNHSKLRDQIHEIGGRTLVCHCKVGEACHGDILIDFFKRHASSSVVVEGPPRSMKTAATLRQGIGQEDSETEADERAAQAGAGWTGYGPPLSVRRGPMQRGPVDGQACVLQGVGRRNDAIFQRTPSLRR